LSIILKKNIEIYLGIFLVFMENYGIILIQY